ncbi:MAG: hypothetical protein INF91_02465 [Alphaproteobacteria bacterium]|nr:hypothetical protein [Alphaproteobacteria bacterium]
MNRVMMCGVAALVSVAAGAAEAPKAGPTPADAAATAAVAARLIAASGAPASDFQTVPDYRLARVKHLPSGLVCSFAADARNSLAVSEGRLECRSEGPDLSESWTATVAVQAADQSAAFAQWTDRLMAETPGARPLVDGNGVDRLGVVKSLAARVAAERTAGWLSSDGGLAYYGVADAGRWRVTYHAAGKPDMVRLIAPMVWLAGLDQIAGRKPLMKTRAL